MLQNDTTFPGALKPSHKVRKRETFLGARIAAALTNQSESVRSAHSEEASINARSSYVRSSFNHPHSHSQSTLLGRLIPTYKTRPAKRPHTLLTPRHATARHLDAFIHALNPFTLLDLCLITSAPDSDGQRRRSRRMLPSCKHAMASRS